MKVFWAWQSDIDGGIGKYFVQNALESAIQSLNESAEIEERPDETTHLHLDHDRKGLPGSPNIVDEILKKIRSSRAFVADVTPIASTDRGKKVINPNVAIEYGFALALLGDASIITVMNLHFGSHEELPFDIRHKGGPVTYHLAPNAEKNEREAQKKKLVGGLVSALRHYVQSSAPIEPVLFSRMRSHDSKGLLFDWSTELANSGPHTPRQPHFLGEGSYIYLRVSPKYQLGKPLDLAAMKFAQSQLGSFSTSDSVPYQSSAWHRENNWGIISFRLTASEDQEIESLSQCFRSGEIWGFNTYALRRGSGEGYLNTTSVERTFVGALNRYVVFLCDQMSIQFPLHVEAGAVGVLNRVITWANGIVDSNLKIASEDVIHAATLGNRDQVDGFLLEFFTKIFLAAGRERPANLNGFPKNEKRG